jgi:hypothetical protein
LSETSAPLQGLLCGKVQPGVTTVSGIRPVAALGREQFALALAAARQPVVGFYRMREGNGLVLSDEEVALTRDLFENFGWVVLLIERRADGPAEGSFFFWKGEVFVHNLPSPFPVDPAILAESAKPGIPEPPGKRRGTPVSLVAGTAIACLLLLLALMPSRHAPSPSVPASVERRAAPAASVQHAELELAWDPQSRGIATAIKGALNIEDGGVQRRILLTSRELQAGSLLYSPTSNRVRAGLTMLQPDGQAVVIGVNAGPPQPRPVRTETVQIEKVATEPEPEPHADRIVPEPVIRAKVEQPARKRFTLASVGHVQPKAPAILEPPPAPELPTATHAFPLAPTLSAVLPAPSHASPPSGRLIWTGTMRRHDVVELDGKFASIGSLNGALPGVPVSLIILPAEFSSGGLVVYTTDAKKHNRVEPPSAGNGWNKTTYIWDPERVKQLAVMEAPNANNRFSRLALRNDARRCSMILIDWAAKAQ